MPGRGKRESRALVNYLSIDDRYSAQTNFDSSNTIGERFRVNRAHKRGVAFLLTVIKRQQWQIGDSLLNFKFGQPARLPQGNPSGFPTFLRLSLIGTRRRSRTFYRRVSGSAPQPSAQSALSPIALLDRPMRFC